MPSMVALCVTVSMTISSVLPTAPTGTVARVIVYSVGVPSTSAVPVPTISGCGMVGNPVRRMASSGAPGSPIRVSETGPGPAPGSADRSMRNARPSGPAIH
ncbi:MAG: hypothetical protein OXH68_20990 [Gammaproteobacteria bacterium]|nr:hypothetical protein [Gammaproteobacteria bacterium]